MELGFYHPAIGYWQAIEGDPDQLLPGYPAGTKHVPVRPSGDHFWNGENWIFSLSIETQRARKLEAVAYRRWQVETGGINLAGTVVLTDRESQGLIHRAYTRATRNPSATVRFKAVSGWVVLAAAEMIAIGDAVYEHVQACFDREGVLAEAISDADETTLAAIDIETGWPGH